MIVVALLKHMHNMKGIPSEFDEPLFKRLFLLAEIGDFSATRYLFFLHRIGHSVEKCANLTRVVHRIGHSVDNYTKFHRVLHESAVLVENPVKLLGNLQTTVSQSAL